MRGLVVVGLLLGLSGCTGLGGVSDGGPKRPVDVSGVADAVPRVEKRTRAGNKSSYTVFGKTYTVLSSSKGFTERGDASWYGTKFHGNTTANGEIYNMYAMTAAHKSLPIPSYVKVTNLDNGRSVVVRVNDRGPFHAGRIIDLSYAAAAKLGYVNKGTAPVEIETVGPGDQLDKGHSLTDSNPRIVPAENSKPKTEGYTLPPNTFLQAGAFSNKNSADSVHTEISKLTSVPASVVESKIDNLFRVRLGPINNNVILMNLRELLRTNKLPETHVVYN
jgi:rare lipoprotein A